MKRPTSGSDAADRTEAPCAEGAARYKLEPAYLAPDEGVTPEERRKLERRGFPQLHGHIPLAAAARAAAGCLIRRATHYRAWPVYGLPEPQRQGAVPAIGAAPALLDELYAWLEHVPIPAGHLRLSALQLHAGDQLLLHHVLGSHDETVLCLTPEQFASLQDCLVGVGLPRDLVYPKWALRAVTDPIVLSGIGEVVLGTQRYSPVAWRRRQQDGPPALRVPTEEERRRRFATACARLSAVVAARLAQLAGGATAADAAERAHLATLLDQLERVEGRYVVEIARVGTIEGDEEGTLLAGSEVVTQSWLADEYLRALRAVLLRVAELREPGIATDGPQEQELHGLLERLRPVLFPAQERRSRRQRHAAEAAQQPGGIDVRDIGPPGETKSE